MSAVTETEMRANVRYLVEDVDAAIAFYTTHLGFTLNMTAAPGSRTSSADHCGSCCPARPAPAPAPPPTTPPVPATTASTS